jgi:hypothetical protein
VAVAARAGDERRAARRQTLQIGRAHLHAVDREDLRVQESAIVKKLNRRPARGHPSGIPRSELLEYRAPRSAAGADELDLLRGFG